MLIRGGFEESLERKGKSTWLDRPFLGVEDNGPAEAGLSSHKGQVQDSQLSLVVEDRALKAAVVSYEHGPSRVWKGKKTSLVRVFST